MKYAWIIPKPARSPWKNCLPRNQSLAPKRLGTVAMDNEQVLSLSVSSSGDSPPHGTSWPKPLTWGPPSPSHLTLLSVSNDDEKSLCGGAALHSREEPAKTEAETPGFAPCSEQADLLTIASGMQSPLKPETCSPPPHLSGSGERPLFCS